MRSPPVSPVSPVSRAVVAAAARASWLVPALVLLVVGVTAPGGLVAAPVLPASAVIPVTTAAAAIGLLIGTFAAPASAWHEDALPERRHALLGIGLSGTLLVTIGIASIIGALSGRQAAEELDRATRIALRDSPGWNGGGRIEETLVSASEVDAGTELAKILLRPFRTQYSVLLLGIDNSAGSHEVTLDLEHLTLQAPNRQIRALSRAELLHATDPAHAELEDLPKVVHVRAGERMDGVRVFLPQEALLRDVVAITLRVDGSDQTIRGRYFTAAEKRSMDAKRTPAPR
jgi:hypothetical protein